MCTDGMTIHPLWSTWIGAYWHKHIVENLPMHTTSYTLQQPSNFFRLGNLSHLNCSSLGTQWCKNHAKPTPYEFPKTSKVKIVYIYIIFHLISHHVVKWCDLMWWCIDLWAWKISNCLKKKSQIWLLNPVCQLTKMKVTWKSWMKNITSKLRMKNLANQ
jgi:hypothetical protein